jgi:hypothetical protein
MQERVVQAARMARGVAPTVAHEDSANRRLSFQGDTPGRLFTRGETRRQVGLLWASTRIAGSRET